MSLVLMPGPAAERSTASRRRRATAGGTSNGPLVADSPSRLEPVERGRPRRDGAVVVVARHAAVREPRRHGGVRADAVAVDREQRAAEARALHGEALVQGSLLPRTRFIKTPEHARCADDDVFGEDSSCSARPPSARSRRRGPAGPHEAVVVQLAASQRGERGLPVDGHRAAVAVTAADRSQQRVVSRQPLLGALELVLQQRLRQQAAAAAGSPPRPSRARRPASSVSSSASAMSERRQRSRGRSEGWWNTARGRTSFCCWTSRFTSRHRSPCS